MGLNAGSSMQRAFRQEHLAQVELQVAECEKAVGGQREIVAGLERDGLDVTRARRLLLFFEESLAMHVADRDRLRQELGSEEVR
jgi:hypothetical protein